jgi:predicted nucleic acid-binding Zn finger protein
MKMEKVRHLLYFVYLHLNKPYILDVGEGSSLIGCLKESGSVVLHKYINCKHDVKLITTIFWQVDKILPIGVKYI